MRVHCWVGRNYFIVVIIDGIWLLESDWMMLGRLFAEPGVLGCAGLGLLNSRGCSKKTAGHLEAWHRDGA